MRESRRVLRVYLSSFPVFLLTFTFILASLRIASGGSPGTSPGQSDSGQFPADLSATQSSTPMRTNDTCVDDTDCEDYNDCTSDSCETGAGVCQFVPLTSGAACGDGDDCTGAESCDGAGVCLAGTPVDCGYLDGPCTVGVCDPGTLNCNPQDRPDNHVCLDDGDPCDGEDVCDLGVCANDTEVSVVSLPPMSGVTNLGGFRARDIANNDYAARFYTAAPDPDYTASDYGSADVQVTYQRSGTFFEGHIEASGLKPNFAYQVKLVGMPTAEFGTAGDDASNERIGYAGRWFRVGSGNSNDAAYQACQADPLCTDVFQGYLLFDFFVTDRLGRASYDFVADESLHVLFRDCPPELPLTGCGSPGAAQTQYQDVTAKAVAAYGYDRDHATWNFGVYGQIERSAPAAWLDPGEYRCRMVLTEESFHETGVGGQWASAVGASGIHFWIDQAPGPRDCDDLDPCDGYESCDGLDVCQSGPAADCDDGNPCTDESCDSLSGCGYSDNADPCNDQDECTSGDSCGGGICAGSPITCDDGVDCTDNGCDPATGCQYVPNNGLCAANQYCDALSGCQPLAGCNSDPECDDTVYCNGIETCDLDNHVCQSGTPVPCDDGQFCNGVESCNEGSRSCDPGTPPTCTDGDGTTSDYCDPSAGACAFAPAFDPTDGRITDSMWVSGMELGGIGVGKLELRTNGELGNFTLNNNWDKWVERAKGTFLAVHVDSGGVQQSRILRRSYSGGGEYAGVDAIDHLRYQGLFPTLQVDYYDSLPVALRLDAFSPLIPQNPADSGLPVAHFTLNLTNESANSADVSVAFSWENILGRGGYDTWSNGEEVWNSINGNYQEAVDLANLQGLRFRTTQSWGTERDNAVGQYLLLVEKGAGLQITSHESWNALDSTPPFWSEFESNGTLTDPVSPPSGSDGIYHPAGALAVKTTLAPAETKQVHLMVVWYMPTHITAGDGIDHGHAYLADPATDTPEEIAEYARANRSGFLAETTEWQDLLLASNLPFWLKLRMINGIFTMFANSVYPQNGEFYTHESLISMAGSLGTSDQRMSFHPYYTMMFPGLDQSELTVFGDVRPGDGRVSHFNGNVGWLLHSSNVGYGVTNWPDLSCSYVMQVLKSYKWTGDATFLANNWTEVQEVMAWLQSADADGDFIPEGGSTYDYEGQNPGAFVYTASAYLGALKAAEELARMQGETILADSYATRFTSAQASVMSNLWTGTYFKKYYRVSDGATTPNSFIASLAGDWLSRYSTSGRTLDVDVTKSAENYILNWHQDLFSNNVAPMEVAPDGSDPAGNCYQYQHEPYIGMQSIYDGYVDEGLQVLYSIYRDHWERARWPWSGRIHPSVYGSGKTGGWNGNYYMSNPATWSVINALSGTSIDVPSQTLYLAPHLPAGWTELHMPVFFPSFWGWLDFDHTTGQVDLEVVKVFGSPITIIKTVAELASGAIVENSSTGLPFTADVGQILSYTIPVDNAAPGAVADLDASWTGSEVQLAWTAPGDDGATGRALRYDIRYATTAIDDGNWGSATPLTRESYPASGGTQESYLALDSLAPDTTYHFAMKSKDEEGNWSLLSNSDVVFTGGGECDDNQDCDDGLYCTGVETCDAQFDCQPGTPVDCSNLDNGCAAVGFCDDNLDSCEALTDTDGMSCDDGNPCTAGDQCWSGACQTLSVRPVDLAFDAAVGGVLDTGFTHLVPTSNGGGLLETNLNLDTGVELLQLTTTVGDMARRSDGTQNNQDNPLAVRVDAASAAGPLRISARLVPDPVHGWDILDDYQSGGVSFGIGEDDYVKLVLFHKYESFGGTENDDPTGVGFQLGVETAAGGGAATENNVAFSGDITTVATLDLHLEVDPASATATVCYQVDGGPVTALISDYSVASGLFTECSYAAVAHTSNDYFTATGDPWHPNYDRFTVSDPDHDSDGYTVCGGGDINDFNAGIYPGADEFWDVGGTVRYYRDSGVGSEPGVELVGGVTLDLQGQSVSDSTTSASGTGSYGFVDLPAENITITPEKLGEFSDSISGLDSAWVAQYLVELRTLTPNQIIAGDVTGGGLSALDAARIAQFRVGMILRFPIAESLGTDWAFVPASRAYQPLGADMAGEDYLGILYGDVTGNWIPTAGARSPSNNEENTWDDLVGTYGEKGRAIGRGQDPVASQGAVRRSPGGHMRSPYATGAGRTCNLSLRSAGEVHYPDASPGLALYGEGCEGLLGLDLVLTYDPKRVYIRGVETTTATSHLQVAGNGNQGTYLVSMYGPEPLLSNGKLLVFQVVDRGRRGGRPPVGLAAAEVNEGQIPTRLTRPPAGVPRPVRAREEREP